MPSRSSDASNAVRMAAPTLSFHGNGMNLVASTNDARRPGSPASRRPMMRSLSPLPYTSAVSNSVTPAPIEASHASAMVASLSEVS